MKNDVGIQLQKAMEMKATAEDFAKILTQKMDDLRDTLEQYVNAGFPEDIAIHYLGTYYAPDRSIIDGLSDDMRIRHVDFLDRVIEKLRITRDEQ